MRLRRSEVPAPRRVVLRSSRKLSLRVMRRRGYLGGLVARLRGPVVISVVWCHAGVVRWLSRKSGFTCATSLPR